jgi:hypothetical protein
MLTLNDEAFWRRQSEGLAVFQSPGITRMYRLPLEFDEAVIVALRFHVKPLLPLFSSSGHFYILALSQNQVRLLEGTRYSVNELDLVDLPKSLAEALRWDDPERQLQAHPTKGATTGGARPAPVYHGHGAGMLDENEKNDILRFFQKVDRGLQDHLAGERIPLVLAGVDYLHPIYRQASSYPQIVEQGIHGNVENEKPEELHRKAWELVKPLFIKEREEAAALYRQQAGMGTGRTSHEITEIAPAAYYGRVGQLFVQEGENMWGTFDPTSGQVSLHEKDLETPEDMDLLDFASAYTYLNNGAVYLVQPSDMPDAGLCAAVLRY